MPASARKDLAGQALARSTTVSDLSARNGVSRKFVYQQANKARCALDDAFISAAADDTVLFEMPLTKRWLRQVIVALALMCRSSYLGILEFVRDLLGDRAREGGWPISIGTVHNVLDAAAEQARVINGAQDLSRIRTGLHDELFHGGKPVLAGVCAESTYCYLMAAEEHRDADTWGVHLLDAARQGLKPDYTIADAGRGLRAGQKAAWGDTPCHGDVFHIIRQCEGLANTLSRLAKGARSRREKLEAKFGRAGQSGPKDALVTGLALAGQVETQARELAHNIRTLIQWLSHDVLSLAGPNLPRGGNFSTSSSMNWNVSSRRMHGASIRCASRGGTSATTCSLSPACSTRNWPASRGPSRSPSPSCARPVCCTACPTPRPLTGRRLRAKIGV